MPHHTGLISLAAGVAAAAREAELVAQRIRKPFGLHRLPVAFLAIALLILAVWMYQNFFLVRTRLKIALPDRDAQSLRDHVRSDRLLELKLEIVPGSREAVDLLKEGKVDLAFVQGGIDIADNLPRLETPNPELILWFVKS